jgi:hypothetical protein
MQKFGVPARDLPKLRLTHDEKVVGTTRFSKRTIAYLEAHLGRGGIALGPGEGPLAFQGSVDFGIDSRNSW